MFTNPRNLYYECDSGYSVEIEPPHNWPATTMFYREAGKSMRIWAEFYARGFGIAISAKTLRGWENPYQDETVDDEIRKRIIDNIRSILEHYKMPLEVIETSLPEQSQKEFWANYDAMMKGERERRSQREESKMLKAQKLTNYLIVMVVLMVIDIIILFRIAQVISSGLSNVFH